MLKIAVCDDEQNYLHDMERLLKEYETQRSIEIEASYFRLPFDLLEQVEKGTDFALYCLDVYMPGITGIAAARQLRKNGIETPVIFLTTSKEHALEAFGVGALGYLVKPFERDMFFKLMDTVTAYTGQERRRHVLLKVEGMLRSVAVRDIIYSESTKNHQAIHLEDGTTMLSRMAVSELFDELSPSGCFVRCGSAYILNLAKIKRLGTKTVELEDDTEIAMPRGAYADVKAAYYAFFSER